jgi:hypothetical protein
MPRPYNSYQFSWFPAWPVAAASAKQDEPRDHYQASNISLPWKSVTPMVF